MIDKNDKTWYNKGVKKQRTAKRGGICLKAKTTAAILLVAALFITSVAATPTIFPDVAEGAWYTDSIVKASAFGLMKGYDDGNFHPDTTITRAQFVQILYNRYGQDSKKAKNEFSDVDKNAWYAKAVIWASNAGIVNGTGVDKFSPDTPLTREQLATILWASKGRPEVNANRTLSKYLDYNQVSDWARDGVAWCVKTGAIKGTTDTTLNPKENTTRAEAATIMVRFVKQ